MTADSPTDNFVVFDSVTHAWVRNATALHFVNSMVGTQRGAKWIIVSIAICPVGMNSRSDTANGGYTVSRRGTPP